ncbi:hypothetical protein [Pasteurella atlantica]|uniref:Uncharacterized protein n=3 Tax=Pasteurellaceae TaxID=712 RepID=A0ACC6HKF8_9PAST|nr:hypothetical protein [Pasteurella atlantica]MDP8051346.1 hypothetical protein [Pasteurella atlantica]MDP8100005.1 hypothetical protein [Pasteurella atlantica]MDP8104774.1 hypothetical protein [Pasteurella atlantica]MDP8107842.1 hypothetical protein [Pasteurella atlantica]MDP8115872.1 hypothetical protein [Pasteurella atlantica]
MTQEYLKFRKCFNSEQAIELKNLLEQEGINVTLVDNLPADLTGNSLNNQPEIHLKPIDFKRAEQIIEKDAERRIEYIEDDYYLFDSPNEELYEILLKPDEWNAFDYTLAKRILKDRGKYIEPELLIKLKEKRLEELAQPKEYQALLITVGYIFAFLGGIFGVLIGYLLWKTKKTLPNGKMVYIHSEENRKQGKQIFYIGLVVTITVCIYRIIHFS